jgi:hypothetical protein
MMQAQSLRRLRTPLIVITFALSTVFLLYAIRASTHVTHGFAMYYTYSRMLVEGGPFEQAYSYNEFNHRIQSYGIEGILDMPNNLPTTAFVLLPVAWLPPVEAKVAWTFLSLIFYGVGLYAMLRAYGVNWNDVRMWCVLALAFLWRPIYDGIALGQIYFMLFSLFMLAAWLIVKARDRTAGFAVGLAFLSKGYGLIPAAWFALRGHRKSAAMFALTLVIGIFATLPLLHMASWERFVSDVVTELGRRPTDAHVAFQTVNSILYHLFTYDARWIPNPAVVLPGVAVAIASYSINLFIVVIVLMRSRGTTSRETVLGFAAAIASSVVTAPLAEEYHFLLFLPLVTGLGLEFWDRWEERTHHNLLTPLFLGSVLVLAVPLRYKALQESAFPLILLAYPKLYAGLVILFCYVRIPRLTSSRQSLLT